MREKPVVAIAMSGGVDSSVAAGLLVEGGFRVIGIMLRLWSEEGTEDKNRCCTPDAVAQARRVAAMLDIPFYVLDAKEIFRSTVVDHFIQGYRNGDTPNPCVLCNQVVRWGFLREQAKAMGADLLATGHYARLSRSGDKVQLLTGLDPSKDQSYVLSRLNQDQLSCTMFPLGELLKSQTRDIARRMKLPVAERADSQDLCFIADGNYRSFLQRHAPDVVQSGEITDKSGKVLGKHQGLAFYTIGQRKGLEIAAPQPLYVMEKDMENNRLIVAPSGDYGCNQFWIGDVNWIEGEPPADRFSAEVKIRYKSQRWDCVVAIGQNNTASVELSQSLRDITPGQLAVFYRGEMVLGSGIIEWSKEK